MGDDGQRNIEYVEEKSCKKIITDNIKRMKTVEDKTINNNEECGDRQGDDHKYNNTYNNGHFQQ